MARPGKRPRKQEKQVDEPIFGSKRLSSVLHPASLSFALIGLLITTFAASALYHSEKQALGARFSATTARVQDDILDRINNYEQVLRGAVGLINSSEDVTREEWQTYVKSLKINHKFPGIQGIGLAKVIERDEIETFEKRIRQEGFPDFEVWPKGERPAYTSIVFLEPFDERNRRAFGYDMMSQPTRAVAMARARDTGLPALSGSVVLKQEFDNEMQPGFLLYLPVYRKGHPLETVEDRRAAIIGYVYSPFRMNDFIGGIVSESSEEIGIRIYDALATQEDSLMYTSPSVNFSPIFQSTIEIHSGGHTWRIESFSLTDFENWLPRLSSLAIALAGVAITLLGMIILADSKSTQERATRIAEQMTETLREREAEVLKLNTGLEKEVALRTARLKEANAELRAFSYTVSHDLRTPVRHISTLTNFLSEDHGKELSENATDYLRRIQKSASHMGQLIEDILTLASCGEARIYPRPVDLSSVSREIVGELVSEHGTRKIEVRIAPEIHTIADPTVARTVLQNIFENAFKFTANREVAEIEFGEMETDRGRTFYIRDNGIGFDMQYADGAFKLFKRLHSQKDFSGTGVGLATVKKMISRHGGSIWVQSEPDHGTTFYFTLGIAPEPDIEESENPHHSPGDSCPTEPENRKSAGAKAGARA